MAVEAIIISGPRKDEFISLPEEIIEEPPAEVVEALNAALKELDAALVAAIEETRAWRAALRSEGTDAASIYCYPDKDATIR